MSHSVTGVVAEGAHEQAAHNARAGGTGALPAGSALLFAAQVATNLGYFVAVLLLARGLDPSARGTVAFLTITALVVSRLARLGVADATTVLAARRSRQRSALLSNLLGFTISAMLGAAGLLSLVILLGRIHPAGIKDRQLILLAVGILASGLVDAGSSFMLGLGRIAELAALNAVGPWIYAAFVATASVFFGLTPTRAVIAWAAGHSIWAAMVVVASKRGTPLVRMDRSLLQESIAFGVRAWIGGLSRFLNFRVDQILMGFISAQAALGIYAVAVNASEVLLILPGAAATALLPALARSAPRERLERTLRIVRSVTLLTAATVIAAAIVGPPLVTSIFGGRYQDATTPFVLLIPGAIGFALMVIFSNALVAASAPGRSSLGPLAALVSGFVLDLILIPPFGASGAAAAATVAFACGGVVSAAAFRSAAPFQLRALAPARADVRALLALTARWPLRPRSGSGTP